MVKKNPTADKVSSVAYLCRKSPLARLCALRDSLSQALWLFKADKKTPDITIGRFCS